MKLASLLLSICVYIFLISVRSVKSAAVVCTGAGATPSHSLCLTTPSQSCVAQSQPAIVLDDIAIQEYIVSQHNIRRAKVAAGDETRGLNGGPQPGTTCMAKLTWSDKLAQSAQNWANRCILSGDSLRSRSLATEADTYVGQNVFAYYDGPGTSYNGISSQLTYWDQAINSWYEEVQNFDKASVDSYAYVPAVGHYTQFVWGRTTQIGCGFRRWAVKDGTGRIVRLLICNYWPGGNAIGKPVYVKTPTPDFPPGPKCDAGCNNGLKTPPSFDVYGTTSLLKGSLCDPMVAPVDTTTP